MADAEDEDSVSWFSELETVLKEDFNPSYVKNISRGKNIPENLRADFWKVCLDVHEKNNPLTGFGEIYDLPEQEVLREDCQQLVDKLGNEEEDKVSVVSDLEFVITYFCKQNNSKYDQHNGWLEILAPLIALRLPRDDLFYCFQAIITNYIPRNRCENEALYHLFRLLILYHDPELCSFLDTKKITPDSYCKSWFRSLFASVCNLKVIHNMWDVYFQEDDPFLIFFLSLVILINAKEQLMVFTDESSENILDMLLLAPAALEADDVEDFCTLAKFYAAKTPKSFRSDYFDSLFKMGSQTSFNQMPILHSLCLLISVEELLGNNHMQTDNIRFFVVDCRPAEQYNSGHLSTAFHLDANLMLREPAAFATAVEALFLAQQQALAADSVAAGEHLCFLGSGREEEDQYMHMVVASFLQKHTQFISVAKGGYLVLHDILKENLPVALTDHSSRGCLVCNREIKSVASGVTNNEHFSEKNSLLGRLSLAVKSKTVEMTEKFVDYIQNSHSNQPEERHVSSKDKLGKRYRNMAPVFTIDDDHEDESLQDIINVNNWLKKDDIVSYFKCHQITENGHLYPSFLVVMESHLYILREIVDKQGFASIVARRSLSSIVKITSKRKHPELITFKYGTSNGESFHVTESDRFLIPQAGDATKLVKQQIVKLLELHLESSH